MNNSISLMFLDDHALVVQCLARWSNLQEDMRVVGMHTTSREFFDALTCRVADVAVIDFSLSPGDIDGLNLIKALRLKYPRLKILVLSATHTPAVVALSLQCGARGFLGKDANIEEIMLAIREVAAGRQYLSPAMVLKVCSTGVLNRQLTYAPSAVAHDLHSVFVSTGITLREREVLRCCLEGMTVTSIARKFSRSVKTISTQKRSAYKKLGLESDNELFRIESWFTG